MVQGLLPVATVYLTRIWVDKLVVAIGSGDTREHVGPILVPVTLMAGVMLLTEVLQSAISWIRAAQSELLQDHISALVHNRSIAVDLAFYESPEYFDHLHRARSDASSRPLALLENGGSLLQNGITLLAAAMAWMIWRAMQGLVTLGDLVLFYQAFNRSQSLMRSLLSNVGQIYTNSVFLGNLFEFLRLQPYVVDPPNPISAPSDLREGLCFRRVSFRYPGSERVALQNFNLTIPAGQIVAIVGANGAGKSTLVKLLCRLYDPEEGSIELDGIDIRELSIEKFRRLITVLFQLPIPYHATAGQNIALGDLLGEPDMTEIETAARSAEAHEIIAHLPQKYDTMLGKSFAGGTELSTGEWQRIALARAFLRQAQIVILDEPTSFMDSWAEAEWLERFRALVHGRMALIITHRFTTAMCADVIHVMQSGQIVESGSHNELLARGGLYAQSWMAQMQTSSSSAHTHSI